MSIANETVLGIDIASTYSTALVTMPDGTVVERPVQLAKRPDGTVAWEMVDEKIAEFDRRFPEDTDHRPASWNTPATQTLTPLPAVPSPTLVHMQAQLIMTLGDPMAIIANRGVTEDVAHHLKAHPSTHRLAYMLAMRCGPLWVKAAHFIKPPYETV